mmetsp:Transcript_11342/g.31821  ORF Transcript_11342/g.31821 Transcript_11342/m.31821 type:complete len:241 (-) Transcript_11342:3014-3736(-)
MKFARARTPSPTRVSRWTPPIAITAPAGRVTPPPPGSHSALRAHSPTPRLLPQDLCPAAPLPPPPPVLGGPPPPSPEQVLANSFAPPRPSPARRPPRLPLVGFAGTALEWPPLLTDQRRRSDCTFLPVMPTRACEVSPPRSHCPPVPRPRLPVAAFALLPSECAAPASAASLAPDPTVYSRSRPWRTGQLPCRAASGPALRSCRICPFLPSGTPNAAESDPYCRRNSPATCTARRSPRPG